MRILHTEWSNGWGGQEIRIINEMLALRNEKHDVFLACRKKSKIYQVANKHQIAILTLPFVGNADFYTILRLFFFLKRKKIQIVNTHSGKDTWVGGISSKLAGIKFIRTRHLSNLINPSRLNFINELCDYVITTGESVRQDMIANNRINPKKIQSIPTGPDERKFNPEKFSEAHSRKIFNLQDDEIAIGMLAVIRRFKRYDKFISMASYITKLYPHKKIKFLLAGDGPQRELVEKLVLDENLSHLFNFLGHIENVPEYLRALDLFVLCSDSGEGVPQSLIQSLMMNTHSIATDVGSVKDLYSESNFKLINKDSQEDLNESVKEFIEERRYKKGTNSREHIVSNFSEKIMTKKLIDIYKTL